MENSLLCLVWHDMELGYLYENPEIEALHLCPMT